ncbi:HdeD family acid-resistance protein [Sphingobium sp. H39-3-25]|uniref:HdeD family acid-resistance protein n=1 Tax=Sphingobium arseniciresistens TaxID=3030834 RepID=UPI0023B98DA4|nr:HdeD family acid-resistance protein [Sphingobium arseniciresistens]
MANPYATRGPDFERGPISPSLSSSWGWILAYAVLVIVIGLLALCNPLATGLATGILFGFILLVYGVIAIAAGLSSLATRARWIEILLGVVALLAGMIVLFNPFAGALSLAWAIGAWLLLSGIFQISGAFRAAYDRGWRLFLGILDVVLGAWLLFSSPGTALAFLAVAVGLSFLFRGMFLVTLAVGLRKLVRA